VGDGAEVGDYGLVVHDPNTIALLKALSGIHDELREIKFHLNLLTEFDA